MFWSVTLALAVALGFTVNASIASATRELDALGPMRSVAVATRDLGVGEVVQPDDVEWRSVPSAAVAGAAITTGQPSAVGRTVFAPIAGGEPIVATRLAPAELHGVAAKTPPGTRAVAIPFDARTPLLVAGQRVDLYAAMSLSDRGDPEPIALDALVVETDEERATIAVAEDHVALVASALIEGTVVIAVAGHR